jgi:hypothetical protein
MDLWIAAIKRQCSYASNVNLYILQACRSPCSDVRVLSKLDDDSKIKEMVMEKHSEVELLKKENFSYVAALNRESEVRNI